MNRFPSDPKKLRARIRSYMRALQREKETIGSYDDSYGKRHFIGPLYLLAGDLEGALKSFIWFEHEFPDDGGESEQCLCWALALHRAGQEDAARQKLRQTMLMNRHILPRLLGRDIPKQKQSEDDFDLDLMYLQEMPAEYFALWTDPERAWAERLYDGAEFQAVRAKYMEIERQLEHLDEGAKRTRLVNEQFKMIYGQTWASRRS